MSHETIYRSLYVQTRGVLKKQLVQHLRMRRAIRHSRHATQKGSRLLNTVSIRERPASVEDRAVPGHWEGDLLLGAKSSQIITLVERQSPKGVSSYTTTGDTTHHLETSACGPVQKASTDRIRARR